MSPQNRMITMPEEEALKRVATLSKGIQEFLASRGELTDITLGALLQSYLSVADQTGRLHEVPLVLCGVIEMAARGLAESRITRH